MRHVEEFKDAAQRHSIHRWEIGRCSFCRYPTAYIFDDDCPPMFDAGCNCVPYHDIQPRTWADVANHYNIQDSLAVIAAYDWFWHFDVDNNQDEET